MGLKSKRDSLCVFQSQFLRFKKTVKSAWNTPVYQVALARPECDSLFVLGKKEVFLNANRAVSSFNNPVLNPHSLCSPSFFLSIIPPSYQWDLAPLFFWLRSIHSWWSFFFPHRSLKCIVSTSICLVYI